LPRDLLIAKARAYREHQDKPKDSPQQLSMSLSESGRMSDEVVKSPFDNNLDVPSYLRKQLHDNPERK